MQQKIFSNFDFSKQLLNGVSLHENLTEAIFVGTDHLVVNFDVLFEGTDLSEFMDALRNIDVKALSFSEDDAFKRDMQLIISENYLNEIFL